MSDSSSREGLQRRTVSPVPFILAVLVYLAVAGALYLETGDPHIGQSYPVGFAILAIVAGFAIELRYVDYP